ncbi:MAG: TM1802 family CRISPR-associated protein [Candidatus Methanoperedens sp.]|nr:hypothetical protein [Candidatus Methanoperedens sp.]MCZ7395689.1 hypothetical protein [Candidatus Methanoperedens sp.]
MLRDIKQLTELYLQNKEVLPADQTWEVFHDELITNASLENIKVLADAIPNKCKYALFVDIDIKAKTYEIKDYVEIGAIEDWTAHLFWQGSGGAKSDKVRSTPHKIYSKKGDFSASDFIDPLETILEDYCFIKEDTKKKGKLKTVGPLFWDEKNIDSRDWLQGVVEVLKVNKEKIDQDVKEKFPAKDSVFVGLTIDNKPIGEYELFRRYLLFVRLRSGIQKGTDLFKNRITSEVIKEQKLIGVCPSCQCEKPLLNQWAVPAELSFYQTTDKCHLSFKYEPDASFRLCRGCSDILYIFKQQLLASLTRKLGGDECLVLPSIKLMPKDDTEKLRLYENLKNLWDSPKQKIASTEERLVYRLGKLPSYATVTFAFGDAIITKGDSTNVRRLDKINVIFPDVLPSRLSKIADAIQNSNKRLNEMWDLTGRVWQCSWKIQDDFYILKQIFYPSWEEKKKDRSNTRPEVERYLRAIFYGQEIFCGEIAEDCFSNLVSAIKTTRKAKEDSNDKYARDNYIGNLLSLFVFFEQLKENNNRYKKEVKTMSDKTQFEFTAMPNLGKFVEMHPLFKDSQYLAPFFVGCLFSYAENLQKENSRLAAYNWLGTMSLKYNDILQDIYPKALNYITNKEKIVSSPRLQELMKAVAHFDKGKCDNDRLALVAFCHGWAVGRDFIYMKKDDKKANAVTT